jgi:hypothetical protein
MAYVTAPVLWLGYVAMWINEWDKCCAGCVTRICGCAG